ncbi:MAG: SRPBCC domain-containing protein [Methanomassiliicoccales archaeon]
MNSQSIGQTDKEKSSKSKDIVITRVFDAPRELVWKSWTVPERFMRWWGPKGYTCPSAKIDLRVGGTYLACMRSPEGKDFWSTGTYKEVVEPERLAMTDSFADEEGKVVPASYYEMAGEYPMELQVSVTFEEHGGMTVMTLKHSGMPQETAEDAEMGWNQSFDKLAEDIHYEIFVQMKTLVLAEPGKHAVIIIRVQNAPRELVFNTTTDPKLVPQFWGPERFSTTIDKMEVRKGGMWRFTQRDPEGNDFAFNGVYHEVKPPERIIDTWEWEGMIGHVLLETITYEEIEGKTKITNITVFQSVEDRDGMYKAGMVEGSEATMDRMAKLLEKMKSL